MLTLEKTQKCITEKKEQFEYIKITKIYLLLIEDYVTLCFRRNIKPKRKVDSALIVY